ncbi:MAG: helix-turn-helix transcriptional regulator [Acidobacteriaceae bacterium]|nr:helix-turn-helix transcriptional regulator [Acidobacteriaceae bacterium]
MAELLGGFEQAVLVAVLRLGPDAYGRTILHDLQKSLKRTVSAGATYTTLDRLENRGLLRSKLAEGTPIRGGRPRRYYALTAHGVRALNEAHETLSAMWSSIQWPAKIAR